MNILPITQSNVNKLSPCFQKGLSREIINKASQINPIEIEHLLLSKGLNASFAGVPSVAFCCLSTVKILEFLKMELPQNFLFCSFPREFSSSSGLYDSQSDTVAVNANMECFFDLQMQNYMEENQASFHPKTKHFLHTYIHEFMHSAHFQHINDKDKYRALSKYAPTALLVDPINAFVKKFVPWFCEDKIDEKYPPNFGYYAYQNLNEFAAERGTFLISQDLNSDLMVDAPSSDSKYTFINPKGETLFEFDKEKTTSKFDKFLEFLYDRQKVLKAIWDGDIETIKSPENKRFIKEI